MTRHRKPPYGDGTAWVVADRRNQDHFCYWYVGANDDRLVDHARIVGASAAVAWGRRRTSRVRIRTADARSCWAGTAPRPDRFIHTWTDTPANNVPLPIGGRLAGTAHAASGGTPC